MAWRVLPYLLLILSLAACNLSSQTAITPLPTPDLPQVEILAPANNQAVLLGTVFDIEMLARDATQGISRVDLYIDNELINSASPVDAIAVPVFRTTMNWMAASLGLHVVEVIAYRPDNLASSTAIINLNVVERP